DGTQEGVKTGEIMTHLEHRWYDDNEKAAAKLSSIFIIPHEESAHEEGEDGGCHFKSTDIQELGEESTASADRIDIRSTVHFFKEKGVDGPIKMDKKISELEDKVCCQNPDSKYFFGEMVFLDEPIPVCSEGGNSVLISDGDSGETCKWVPAIQIDECELMGGHMVKLVTNDMNLGSRISEVCNEFADYTTRLAGVVDGNIAKLADAIDCLNDALQTFAAANNVAHAVTLDAAIAHTDGLFQHLQADINFLVNQINQALQLCGCEGGIVAPNISFGPHGERPGEVAIPDGCNVGSITRTPELDCDVCYGTRLHGPCTTQEEFV